MQGMNQEWQKNLAGTRQPDGKNIVWFREIERKLAKLSKTTFTSVLPLNYFMLLQPSALDNVDKYCRNDSDIWAPSMYLCIF
jgi:hypothetical protein